VIKMERIDLKKLAKHGLIKSGDVFVWHRKFGDDLYKVTLTKNFYLQSGEYIFKTPTSAARHFNGNKPVNGWLVWKLVDHKVSLENLRSKYIESTRKTKN
jgi:hypothetical protein